MAAAGKELGAVGGLLMTVVADSAVGRPLHWWGGPVLPSHPWRLPPSRAGASCSLLQDYQGGEFSLFFANCEPNSAVDFNMEIALYNVKGNRLDFLPVGEDMLPFVYFVSWAGQTVMLAEHRAVGRNRAARVAASPCMWRLGCMALP